MRKLNLLIPYIYSIRGFVGVPTKLNSSLDVRFGLGNERYKKLNQSNTTNNINFEHVEHRNNLHPKIKKYLIEETNKIINIDLPLSVGHWICNNKIEAFFVHAFSNDKIYNSKKINSIIAFELVTSSRIYYKLCSLCLFNTLLYRNNIDYIFIYVNAKYFLKLLLSMGFEITNRINELSSPQNKNMNLNSTNVLKIETNKLLSNKDFLFFCLQNRIDLKAENPQLLEEIDKIYN